MLYTRKGDKGTSSTLEEKKIPKGSYLFEALGTLDELNSYIGVCRAQARKADLGTVIGRKSFESICEELQQNLFLLQAELAGSDKKVKGKHIKRLEDIVDLIEKELPPIKSFFLSGATILSSHLDYARTVTRRAERCITRLGNEKELSYELSSYTNRLSSVFYALARLAVLREGEKEIAPTYK